MAAEDLNKLYSPSQYSHRMSAEAVVEEHIRLITEESGRIRTGSIPKRLGVPYGDSEREKVDIFGTDLPDDVPVFVYFSGGYWQLLSGELSAYVVEPMYQANIVTVVVDYARAPGVTLTEIVGQAVGATKWVHEFATRQRKAKSITLAGHSAGAHLCSMVFGSDWFSSLCPEEASLFAGVVLLSGIYDLKPLVATYVNEPLGMTVEEAEANSPLSPANVARYMDNLKTKAPNFETAVVFAEHESPPFKAQADMLYRAYKERGLERVTLQLIPNVDHFNLVERLSSRSYAVTAMIRKMTQQN